MHSSRVKAAVIGIVVVVATAILILVGTVPSDIRLLFALLGGFALLLFALWVAFR